MNLFHVAQTSYFFRTLLKAFPLVWLEVNYLFSRVKFCRTVVTNKTSRHIDA